jgi:hypothetical protein
VQQPYSEKNAYKPTPPRSSFVVKRSGKASWAQQLLQWMLVTVKSYLTLTLKETFLTGFSQHNKTFQLDIKAVQMAC